MVVDSECTDNHADYDNSSTDNGGAIYATVTLPAYHPTPVPYLSIASLSENPVNGDVV